VGGAGRQAAEPPSGQLGPHAAQGNLVREELEAVVGSGGGGEEQEEGDNEEEEEEEEDDDDDDDDDDDEEERVHLEPAMIEPPEDADKEATGSRQTMENILEQRITVYSGCPYGVPGGEDGDKPNYIVHLGEPMEFETADDMNSMLNSKSPDEWKGVRTKHISIVRNNSHITPPGWWEGKPDAPKKEDLPYETFMYISPYVKPNEDDPESVLKAEHDKRHLRHMHKQVALKLCERFNELEKAKDPERRKSIAPIVDWKLASSPQVKPDVVGWESYKTVTVATSFSKRVSAPRPKGTQKKSKMLGNGESVVMPPAVKGKKRKPDEMSDAPDDGEGSSSTVQPIESMGDCAHNLAFCRRLRVVDVANSAKTHVYTMNNKVYIVEH